MSLYRTLSSVSTVTFLNTPPGSKHGLTDASDSTPSQPNRKTLSTAFILNDIQPDKFSDFLWVFYNPTHSLYNTKSHHQWFGILKVAKLYSFQLVTKLVFRELSNLVDNMDTNTKPDTESVTSLLSTTPYLRELTLTSSSHS